MFTFLQQVYRDMQAVPDSERGNFVTAFVLTAIVVSVYYIVAGLVVWALGRRLIQAGFAAYRESRRERT